MMLQTDDPTLAPDPSPALVAPTAGGAALVQALTAALDKVAEAIAEADPVEMVHDARKALKEYRALLRLIPDPAAKTARHTASATARTLSATRDRQAARDALAALRKADMITELGQAQALALIDAKPHPAADDADHRATLQAYLAAARADHEAHLNATATATDVVAGLRKAYAQARRTRDWSHPEGLHELRKRVVTHRYQMAFAADFSRGGKGEKRARRAQRLRDVLGLHQDLETLKQLLPAALGTADEAALSDVAAASRALQRRLVKQARASHMRLFRRRPSEFEARVRRALPPPPH